MFLVTLGAKINKGQYSERTNCLALRLRSQGVCITRLGETRSGALHRRDIKTYRAYSFQWLIREPFKTQFRTPAQLTPDVLTNYDLARLCGCLDSRSGVTPVAVQIAIGGHCHISQMNTYP